MWNALSRRSVSPNPFSILPSLSLSSCTFPSLSRHLVLNGFTFKSTFHHLQTLDHEVRWVLCLELLDEWCDWLSEMLRADDHVGQGIAVGDKVGARLFELLEGGLVHLAGHVGARHEVEQEGGWSVLLRQLIEGVHCLLGHAGSGRQSDVNAAQLRQDRIFVHSLHGGELALCQVESVYLEVDLQRKALVLHGLSLMNALQGLLLHAAGQEDVGGCQLHGWGDAIAQHRVKLRDQALLSCLIHHVELGSESQGADGWGCGRLGSCDDLVILPRPQLAPQSKFLTFALQRRAHRTSHDGLGFLKRHAVVPQPELGTKGVKLIWFRHGEGNPDRMVVVVVAFVFFLMPALLRCGSLL
mmetsp:Transcript_3094/g.8391  ORF Transcript_3094/g.8391 Transcript_3094/m.8391 type:complete len:355 (-) Transcript_3094:59-1123(-)